LASPINKTEDQIFKSLKDLVNHYFINERYLKSAGTFSVPVNSKDKVIAFLNENGGTSHLHDKSSPHEIREILDMSKQTFKNTIGMLYRERKIVITKTGIHLP